MVNCSAGNITNSVFIDNSAFALLPYGSAVTMLHCAGSYGPEALYPYYQCAIMGNTFRGKRPC
jgi:hypothetical protein